MRRNVSLRCTIFELHLTGWGQRLRFTAVKHLECYIRSTPVSRPASQGFRRVGNGAFSVPLRCFVEQKPRREAGAALIVAQEQGDSKGEGVLKDYVLALFALPAARLLVCAQCSTPTSFSRPSR
jgi:hypothetical protein